MARENKYTMQCSLLPVPMQVSMWWAEIVLHWS